MKILIVGGGITGLSLAAFLKQRGIVPTILEKHPKWTHRVGFGLAIMPGGRRILGELGLADELDAMGYKIPYYETRDSHGNVIMSKEFSEIDEKYGPTTMIARCELHDILRKAIEGVPVKLGVTIASLENHSHGVKVSFSDGTQEEYDLVVGSDGIYSQMRSDVFKVKQPDYYGWTNWLFWADPKIDLPRGVTHMWGPKSFFVVYPGKERTAVYLAAVAPPHQADPEETRIDRLKELFKDYGWVVPELLESFRDPKELFHDDLATVRINEWVRGRVVLAGDSEHAMTPLLGMGATMGMEDARFLADELGASDIDHIDQALKRYSKYRTERVQSVHKVSNMLWNWVAMENSLLCNIRNAAVRLLSPDYFFKPVENLFSVI